MTVSRALYMAGGLTLVGIGMTALVIPGIPTTVFMILALFCFKKSSPRLEKWLLEHKRFGPTLQDWERDRTIKPRTKVVAVATMWVFIALAAFFMKSPWMLSSVVLLGLIGTWYILSRPSSSPESGKNRQTVVS